MEPRVARYIIHADLTYDDWPHRPRLPPDVLDVDGDDEPLAALFARSPYLAQAGLVWKEFYAQIKEDHDPYPRYSQYAAAFLLTLLPNVKTLMLPVNWEPQDKTNKLLEVIVRKANQPSSPWNRHSLAQVTEFQPYCAGAIGSPPVDWNEAVPFLALPNVRSYCGRSCLATGDTSMLLVPQDPYLRYGETLETVNFDGCCIDEVAITEFLKHTPRLSALKYIHRSREDGDNQDWNICKFVTAIEREVGSHLEQLSISIRELRGSIAPGKASMCGFQRLQKLQLPLEFAMCNIREAGFQDTIMNNGFTDQRESENRPLICDLVPASVSELSWQSRGGGHHEMALKAMFRDFAAIKDSNLPALNEIHLSCLYCLKPDNEYRKECERLAAETEKVGVVLHLQPSLD
ncbi:hypothetical protein E0Z10_g1919 [Xylaria hypoxylon]|uniref:Uncharacterized protein n=1 Tax=Xylaria hypoxylon TaxID=37992 RepID=A0A4Z0ZBK8_9PEZI|nr:hypothetical protein E0Z10_g1919 [Xylaria hypoxylon]